MKITIDHCRYTPRWETLQTLLRETTNDHKGVVIGISRRDRGCDYRAPGGYDVRFRLFNGCVLTINLEVKGV